MVSAPFISAETQMQETLQKQSGGVAEQLPEGKSYSQVRWTGNLSGRTVTLSPRVENNLKKC